MYELLNFILKYCDINATNKFKHSAFFVATLKKRSRITELLIIKGISNTQNYCSVYEWSVLHLMASIGRLRIMQLLIDNGIDMNLQDRNGNTALHTAKYHDKIHAIELLIANGADTTVLNKEGLTYDKYCEDSDDNSEDDD